MLCQPCRENLGVGGKQGIWRQTQFLLRASLVAQLVKNLPAIQETRILFLDRENSPEGGNGNPLQYSCLENSMDRGPGGLQSIRQQRVGHDWATEHACTYIFNHLSPQALIPLGNANHCNNLLFVEASGCYRGKTTYLVFVSKLASLSQLKIPFSKVSQTLSFFLTRNPGMDSNGDQN